MDVKYGAPSNLKTLSEYNTMHVKDVSQKASNYAVLGDCGRNPLYIVSWQRVLRYWLKILKMPNDRYVRKYYDMLYHFDALGYKIWAS